ncbi:low molecular weight protein-tyrosine-phosphatase [Chitinophagaceae bacterium MMS25-I14]
MRILMVCLGNICRSPIAEGVMRHKIQQHGLSWEVHSAGTNSYQTGEAPHRFSQKICLAHGVDISGQRARRFKAADFNEYDIIYAMADDVYSEIETIGGKKAIMNKVALFLNELKPGSNASVPDPWYGDESGYAPVFNMIDETCDAIISKYSNQ